MGKSFYALLEFQSFSEVLLVFVLAACHLVLTAFNILQATAGTSLTQCLEKQSAGHHRGIFPGNLLKDGILLNFFINDALRMKQFLHPLCLLTL